MSSYRHPPPHPSRQDPRMLRLPLLATLFLVNPIVAADSIIRTARCGPWSEAATWEGNAIPGEGARVLIRNDNAVVYDIRSDAVIRGISISGSLSFDPERDTLLTVGLIKIQPGDEYSEDGFDCDAHLPASAAGTGKLALEVGT